MIGSASSMLLIYYGLIVALYNTPIFVAEEIKSMIEWFPTIPQMADHLETEIDPRSPRSFPSTRMMAARPFVTFKYMTRNFPDKIPQTYDIGNWEVFVRKSVDFAKWSTSVCLFLIAMFCYFSGCSCARIPVAIGTKLG